MSAVAGVHGRSRGRRLADTADLSVLILVNEAVPHSACNVGRRPGRWKHGVGGRKHGVGGQLYNPDLSAGSAYPT